jgi:AraC-like DNA-binding protein
MPARESGGKPLRRWSYGQVPSLVGWQMANHVHPTFHELIVILNGTLETRIREQTLLGRRGDVFFYPRGEWHAERASGREPFESIFVSWGPDATFDTTPWPLRSFDREGRMAYLARWILDSHPATPSEERLLDSLLFVLLSEYQRLQQSPEHELILRVKRYFRAHLPEEISLNDVAQTAGLSKFHFARLFREVAGEPPMQMLRRMRVEAARALLYSTPLPLKAIALQVGLNDEFHLSRVFRKILGCTPSSLRGRRGKPVA